MTHLTELGKFVQDNLLRDYLVAKKSVSSIMTLNRKSLILGQLSLY
jgi:hypothetical protein